MIKGKKIELVPATLADRPQIYEWCFQSETTKYHAGPPDYPDIPIPTYAEFYETDDGGYTEYYFTGAKPADGGAFSSCIKGRRSALSATAPFIY